MLNKCVIEITQSFKTHFLFDFFNFYCLNLINISTIGLKNDLTLEALKNFSTYKDECVHFGPFICKTVYERFLSNYFECCVETSQSIILD